MQIVFKQSTTGTVTLICVITEKNLYFNLIVANIILLWVAIRVSLGP